MGGDVGVAPWVGQVADDGFDLVVGEAGGFGLIAGEAPDAVPVAPQRGRHGEADVAGGAGEEDLHEKGTVACGERVPWTV